MPDSPRAFRNTLLAVWPLAAGAAFYYGQLKRIPPSLVAALLPAFLLEISLYLAPGFDGVRQFMERRFRPAALAAWLAGSAVASYSLYSIAAGGIRWGRFAVLAAAALAVSFWFLRLPRRRITDAAFLLVMAGVVLLKPFSWIYLRPAPQIEVEILGHLMWIRLGIWAVLLFRRPKNVGFGFLPLASEWRTGLRYYLLFLPFGLTLALGTGFVRFAPPQLPWWAVAPAAAGTFVGMFLVVALSEEFFFRGLLQQWLSEWMNSPWWGLALASVLFGLVHLPFRGFPNWRFALLATVAGWFYGLAYQRGGGIRAAMVAHALVNTTVRLLFR